ASFFMQQLAGYTLLAQVSQALTMDHRDSKTDPHTGYLLTLGNDVAGLGGNADFVRTNLNGQYFIPLDRFTGNSDWGISLTGGVWVPWEPGPHGKVICRASFGCHTLRRF